MCTELHAIGVMDRRTFEFETLTHFSDMTGADRSWAAATCQKTLSDTPRAANSSANLLCSSHDLASENVGVKGFDEEFRVRSPSLYSSSPVSEAHDLPHHALMSAPLHFCHCVRIHMHGQFEGCFIKLTF